MIRPFVVQEAAITKNSTGVQKATMNNSFSVFPNPASVSTTIQFKLAEEGRVTIKTYAFDVREVSKVFEGVRSSGTCKITFNAAKLPTEYISANADE